MREEGGLGLLHFGGERAGVRMGGGVGVLISCLRPLVGERVGEFEIVWLLPREQKGVVVRCSWLKVNWRLRRAAAGCAES